MEYRERVSLLKARPDAEYRSAAIGIVGEVRGVMSSNEKASVKFTKLMKILVAFVRRYSTSISVATIALVGLRILSYHYKVSPDSLERAAEFLEKRADKNTLDVESVLTEVGKNASSTESNEFLAELGKPVEKVVKEMKQSATAESIEGSADVLGGYSFGAGATILTSILVVIRTALTRARRGRELNSSMSGGSPVQRPFRVGGLRLHSFKDEIKKHPERFPLMSRFPSKTPPVDRPKHLGNSSAADAQLPSQPQPAAPADAQPPERRPGKLTANSAHVKIARLMAPADATAASSSSTKPAGKPQQRSPKMNALIDKFNRLSQ